MLEIMKESEQNVKVLFLEDSDRDIEIVNQKLTDDFAWQLHMDTAQSENQFLELIKNNTYDVILADYSLPGYNAVSALEQVQKICPTTPFICVSGTIGEDRAVEMLKQGAADYVLKDRLERLPFAVKRAIESGLLEMEKKETEQQLKQISESNRLILDSINDGIEMLDRDGIILNINEKSARRLGKTVESLIGMSIQTFLPEEKFGDLYQQRLKTLRKVFDSGQPELFEDSRSGVHFYNRYYPIFKDGQVSAVTLFSTDITDKKKAEEEAKKNSELRIEAEMLRKKEIEYLEILDGSTEASWIFDFENGTLKYSYEWKKRIDGEDVPDEEMNLYAMSRVHPDDVENVIHQRKAICERKPAKYISEYRFKINTGEYIWVYDQGKVVYNKNGAPAKIFGTSMDITERKKAEEALRESEARFRSVLGNSMDVIYRTNLQTGHFDYISPSAEVVMGYTPEQYMAMSSEEALAMIHPDDLPAMRAAIARLNETGIAEATYRQRTMSGEYCWVSNHMSMTRDSAGQPLYRNGNIRDITARKKTEEALQKSERKALALVGELEKADHNKNEFLNALSHELRNPLATIVAGLSLLNLTEDKQKIAKAKAIMQRQIDQICHLVDDLLDITRITTNKIRLNKKRIDLNELIAFVVEDFTKFFEEKDVTIMTETNREPIYLYADPVRLNQMIGNLLHNALKFCETGGQTRLTVYKEQNAAVIHVADNGVGIHPEFLSCLFEPFKQADKSLDRNNGGLGLGLSIVKGITQLHGGSVSAISAGFGKGSEFIIKLPLNDEYLKEDVVE